MRTLFFTILILFSLARASSQTVGSSHLLKGKIKSIDKQIMYAAVGIMGANVGTITDQIGNFELQIPDKLIKQKLTISHIGYKTLNLNIDSLLTLDSVIIELTEKVELLEEVIVTSEKLKSKTKEYGNKKKHDFFLWIQKGDRGSEIATLISPESEIHLNTVSVNILNNSEKEFTLLLNLYTVNKISQLPEEQILKNQKIINSNLKKGWLEVDLIKENIILNEPFFVSFQWVSFDEPIPLIGGKRNITKNSLIRYKALGTWEEYAEWDIKVKGTSYKAP